MTKVEDLAHIRATLVDRIAQHVLSRDQQSMSVPSETLKRSKEVEYAVAYWQTKVSQASTVEARDYAFERLQKLTKFVDAQPIEKR